MRPIDLSVQLFFLCLSRNQKKLTLPHFLSCVLISALSIVSTKRPVRSSANSFSISEPSSFVYKCLDVHPNVYQPRGHTFEEIDLTGQQHNMLAYVGTQPDVSVEAGADRGEANRVGARVHGSVIDGDG